MGYGTPGNRGDRFNQPPPITAPALDAPPRRQGSGRHLPVQPPDTRRVPHRQRQRHRHRLHTHHLQEMANRPTGSPESPRQDAPNEAHSESSEPFTAQQASDRCAHPEGKLMAIRARLPQPCMAYCGGDIVPGMWIEEGPNGWEHLNCPRAKQHTRSSPPIHGRVHAAAALTHVQIVREVASSLIAPRRIAQNPCPAAPRGRCSGCGHPSSTHTFQGTCDVPRCACHDWMPRQEKEESNSHA